MSAPFNTIDLATLGLKPGQASRVDVELTPEGLDLGGEGYAFAPAKVPTRLDVSRTAAGYALRLRLTATLAGPCMRCLADGRFEVEVDAREIDQPGTGDEELTSPYVDEGVLDVSAWAHDAIALALPQTLLCRPDCAGLCPECGISLNDVDPATHVHEAARTRAGPSSASSWTSRTLPSPAAWPSRRREPPGPGATSAARRTPSRRRG